jgi:hypothetical protein
MLWYGSRHYDPELGRFIQPDSIVPDAYNSLAYDRYSYANNNPLYYTDPSGHAACSGPNGECKPVYSIVKDEAIEWAKNNLNEPPDYSADCTDYASDILYFGGGLPADDIWHPGSLAWIRTPNFYDYLVNVLGYETIPKGGLDGRYQNPPDLINGEWVKGPLTQEADWLDLLKNNTIPDGSFVFYQNSKEYHSWTHVAFVIGHEVDVDGINKPIVLEHSGDYPLPRFLDLTSNMIEFVSIVIPKMR